MRPVHAFTLIEMLVVFVIISIVAGMSLPGVIGVVGKTKLRKAADAIVMTSREARQYALSRQGNGQSCYGVCIAVDGSGRYYATVILGGAGDGAANHAAREVMTPGGEPALRRWMPVGAEVWIGGVPLKDTVEQELAWYYTSRSGRPTVLQSGGFSPGAVAVGFTPGVVSSGQLDGAWGISGYHVPMTILAPDTPTDPGLSVRSGASRHALALYPTGFLTVIEP